MNKVISRNKTEFHSPFAADLLDNDFVAGYNINRWPIQMKWHFIYPCTPNIYKTFLIAMKDFFSYPVLTIFSHSNNVTHQKAIRKFNLLYECVKYFICASNM